MASSPWWRRLLPSSGPADSGQGVRENYFEGKMDEYVGKSMIVVDRLAPDFEGTAYSNGEWKPGDEGIEPKVEKSGRIQRW
jgi:hypothetical protein